jgi:hypothetical protein
MRFIGGFFMLLTYCLNAQIKLPFLLLNPNENFIERDAKVQLSIRDYYRSGLSEYQLTFKGLGKRFQLLCEAGVRSGVELSSYQISLGSVAEFENSTSLFKLSYDRCEKYSFRAYHRQLIKASAVSLEIRKNNSTDYIALAWSKPYRDLLWFSLHVEKYNLLAKERLSTGFFIRINDNDLLSFRLGLNHSELIVSYVKRFKFIRFIVNIKHHQDLGFSPNLLVQW